MPHKSIYILINLGLTGNQTQDLKYQASLEIFVTLNNVPFSERTFPLNWCHVQRISFSLHNKRSRIGISI